MVEVGCEVGGGVARVGGGGGLSRAGWRKGRGKDRA